LKAATFFLFLFFCCTSSQLEAQNFINENSLFECDQAFSIELPLTLKNNPTVFYQYEEQFSFWYKLKAQSAAEVNIELRALNKEDRYTVLAFEYNRGDFCSQVFNKKIKPLKTQLKENEDRETGILTQFKLITEPEKNYYICVLNTSISNCGHELSLTNGTNKTTIKAIHIPCVIPEEEITPQEQSELPGTNNSLTTFIKLVDQQNAAKHIKAEIAIEDPETNSKMTIDFNSSTTHPLRIQKGKTYSVTCIAPGYKRFEHQLVISEYIESDSSDFLIFLELLQRGDKFLMSHIYFHPNTYALKKKAVKELDYLVNFLKNNPSLNIELAGHTNGNNRIRRNRAYKNRSEQWNFKGNSKKLSVLRAEEIKRKLVKIGVDKERISTVGFGGDKMLIKDARTLKAIEKNVRVEVKIS
jgi:outer membrane protein OmpA-like peptidoglycan-associated protein/thioredoxin-related protein